MVWRPKADGQGCERLCDMCPEPTEAEIHVMVGNAVLIEACQRHAYDVEQAIIKMRLTNPGELLTETSEDAKRRPIIKRAGNHSNNPRPKTSP